MKVIVCVDDNFGILFNNRRQSRDRVLVAEMIKTVTPERLFIKNYSLIQFAGENEYDNVFISEDPISECGEDDYYFNEVDALAGSEDQIDTVIVYKWNRSYPYDVSLELALGSYNLVSSEDFEGSSHEKITKEVYIK